MYKRIYLKKGRAFILQDKKTVLNLLQEQIKNSEKEIVELEVNDFIFIKYFYQKFRNLNILLNRNPKTWNLKLLKC